MNNKPLTPEIAEEWQKFLREINPNEPIYLQLKDIRALRALVAFYLSRQGEPILG